MNYDCGFIKENKWFRYRAAAIIIEKDHVLFAGNERENYYFKERCYMENNKKFETKRLILREFSHADFEDVHAYASNLENIKYMIWGPNSEEDTIEFLDDCISNIDKNPRTQYDFAITLKENGKVIGGCGIYLNNELYEGMLGWVLHKDYWKQGYMTEAGKELLRFAFEDLKLHRLYATCDAENYGSYRVMENLGMRREGHIIKNRKFTGFKDEWHDELFYGILYEEWAKRKGYK